MRCLNCSPANHLPLFQPDRVASFDGKATGISLLFLAPAVALALVFAKPMTADDREFPVTRVVSEGHVAFGILKRPAVKLLAQHLSRLMKRPRMSASRVRFCLTRVARSASLASRKVFGIVLRGKGR